MLDDYHRGSGEESLAAVLPQTAEYFQVEVVDAKANYSQQNTLDADIFNPSGEREAFDEKHEAILTFDIQAARAAAVVLCGKAASTGNPYCVLCIDRHPAQACAVTNGSGTASADVTSVEVSCSTVSTTNAWTWEGGSNIANQLGSYGTEGTAAPGNIPGGRYRATNWIDSSGNFWLFGGSGYDSVGTDSGGAALNDLWKYSPSTGEWTWMGGSNTGNQLGIYGTMGVAAASNVPGGRDTPTGWTDNSGNFWLFGGIGVDSAGNTGELNDLWKYSPSTGEWTWMAGSNLADQSGTYGTKGTAAAANIPGARWGSASWVDASGNLWLFGGLGVDDASADTGEYSDLWEYSPSTGEWTWVGGQDVANQVGTYGTKGTAAAANIPGGRERSVTWIDASKNIWLFGGLGYDSVGTAQGNLNDLWKYGPQ